MSDHDGIDRAITAPTIEGAEGRSIRLRRRYDAAIDDVWEACTVPDRLDRWFLRVEGDLRPGGTYQLTGNAGGEIVRCEPPRLLSLTWCFGGGPCSRVELRLTPDGEGTVLELEHATPSDTVEIDGRLVNVFVNDPETGIWGIGTGWEMPLTQSLPHYLAGELPDAPASEWFEFTPEMVGLADEMGARWATVLAASRDGS